MSSDKDGIWTRERGDVCFKEITNVDIDAWGSEATGVFVYNGLALRTDLKGADCQMRELLASLNRYAACAEADIPEDVSLG